MWKLIMRGARGTPFLDVGSYASITEAAEAILKNEGTVDFALFLKVWVDTAAIVESDAEILSHLSYQGAKHYYELTRKAN
jgi:hypothetical protein